MKKAFFFIIILVGTVAFAFADYFFNAKGVTLTPATQSQTTDPIDGLPQEAHPNQVEALLKTSPSRYNYSLLNRSRVRQIFEVVDVSDLSALAVYASQLVSQDPTLAPITIYEVQGPMGQGGLTYLNIKLKFINLISATANVNEVGTYGQNSFFYNNVNTPKTAYLVTQIGDSVFGFQYPKETPATFEVIKQMIQAYVTASKPL